MKNIISASFSIRKVANLVKNGAKILAPILLFSFIIGLLHGLFSNFVGFVTLIAIGIVGSIIRKLN